VGWFRLCRRCTVLVVLLMALFFVACSVETTTRDNLTARMGQSFPYYGSHFFYMGSKDGFDYVQHRWDNYRGHPGQKTFRLRVGTLRATGAPMTFTDDETRWRQFVPNGLAGGSARRDVLPDFLVGQWVSADFKVANANAEPTDGLALYLLADGRAIWLAAPEVGALSKATYNSSSHVLTVTDLVTKLQSGPPTSYRFRYDLAARTFTLFDMVPQPQGDDLKEASKEPLRRRSKEIPRFIHEQIGRVTDC
jgi:hypothetical protein